MVRYCEQTWRDRILHRLEGRSEGFSSSALPRRAPRRRATSCSGSCSHTLTTPQPADVEEEAKLAREIEGLRQEQDHRTSERARLSEVAERFEEVARILREMDLDEIWQEATDEERRVLVEELLDAVAIFPDHLEVTVQGAPRLNVTLEEAGLKPAEGQFVGVGGATRTLRTPLVVAGDLVLGIR
jgi:hypothetical protein